MLREHSEHCLLPPFYLLHRPSIVCSSGSMAEAWQGMRGHRSMVVGGMAGHEGAQKHGGGGHGWVWNGGKWWHSVLQYTTLQHVITYHYPSKSL